MRGSFLRASIGLVRELWSTRVHCDNYCIMTDFDTVCHEHRTRIRSLPLEHQSQQTIEYRGTIYSYDPEYDCFYPNIEAEELSLWDRYGWLVVIVALTLLSIITA